MCYCVCNNVKVQVRGGASVSLLKRVSTEKNLIRIYLAEELRTGSYYEKKKAEKV